MLTLECSARNGLDAPSSGMRSEPHVRRQSARASSDEAAARRMAQGLHRNGVAHERGSSLYER